MTNYSVPTLRKYAYLGNFGNSVQELADMARPERWNYDETPGTRKNIILENYVYHTFNRLRAQQEANPRAQLHIRNGHGDVLQYRSIHTEL